MNKRLSVFVFFVFVALPSQASEWPAAFLACQQIKADTDRLVCYDRLVDTGLTTAQSDKLLVGNDAVDLEAAAHVEDRLLSQQQSAALFGLEHKTTDNPNINQQLTTTVMKTTEDAYGKLKIVLANEQVWKQIDSRRMKLKSGDNIEISRGVLNSFLLKKAKSNVSIRVKRVK